MQQNGSNIGEILVILASLGIAAIIGIIFMKQSRKSNDMYKNSQSEGLKNEIKKSDLIEHMKNVYSKHFRWDDAISIKSAYVAGKKEFAKKLLDNINNEEEFLKIYNSDYVNPNLLNVNLDKKYDKIEKLYGIPLDLAVNFDEFNIKDGTLTERIKKLIIAWYKEGIKEVKNDIKYQVKAKDWNRVTNTLERIVSS